MADEDQERFEDYLELERYIEELQAGRPAHPPKNLTPEQVRIYRMVALFRAATPEAAEPHPEFASALHERLLALEAEEQDEDTLKLPRIEKQATVVNRQSHIDASQEEQSTPQTQISEVPARPAERTGERKKALFFSRRNLMRGGAVAAVSLVAGAGGIAIGAASDRASVSKNSGAPPAASSTPATSSHQNYSATMDIDADVATIWQPVTTLAALGESAVRFATSTLVGYIIRGDGDEGNTNGAGVIALSAACTHRGCIVQWQDTDRQFHCPCHGGIFTEYGAPSPSAGKLRYLDPLPRLETKIEQGLVYVKVPTPL